MPTTSRQIQGKSRCEGSRQEMSIPGIVGCMGQRGARLLRQVDQSRGRMIGGSVSSGNATLEPKVFSKDQSFSIL